MAQKLKLTLGNVEATIELRTEDAPESSKLLKSLLPLQQRARHSMENGREVYILLDPKTEVPDENQTIYQTVGDVLLYYKPSVFVEPDWTGYANQMPVLSWVYERDTAIMGTYGPIATNVVGTIIGGLEKLQTEAPRMRREGMGTMNLSLIE
ncbi:MAG: DUF3830 family protein [Thaumarchaeota archaeon]|nr:DUF3830 family protein [Nitrososphaerota archaeon]